MNQTRGQSISLDVLKIDSPCRLPRNALPRSEAICFCKTCDKPVHNLTKLTTAQAQALIASAPEEVCIQMERDGKGRLITLDYARSTGSRPRRWISLAASMSLIAAGFQLVKESSRVVSRGGVCPRSMIYSPPTTAPCTVPADTLACDDTTAPDQ
jgi:hypothetical protein